MARKTKAEAALTRHRIVTCARKVFCRDGVTNTTLEAIAKEAEVTRGAVYWHFKNKADLFIAVRAETGPLLRLLASQHGDALDRLETGLQKVIHRLCEEEAARESYEMMLWKCEYVGEFAQVRADLVKNAGIFLEDAARLYAEAKEQGIVSPDLDPELAAHETFCLYAGMVKTWIADKPKGPWRSLALRMISQHIALRRRVPSRVDRPSGGR
jgi:TetR/AcrR family acrAB operon transcriptional repressor